VHEVESFLDVTAIGLENPLGIVWELPVQVGEPRVLLAGAVFGRGAQIDLRPIARAPVAKSIDALAVLLGEERVPEVEDVGVIAVGLELVPAVAP